MKFDSLKIKNFRNYADLSLEIPPGVVVFYGPNGQGKTNLMEAFHFLLRGDSFRPVSSDSLLQHTDEKIAHTALLQGRLTQNDLTYDVKMTFAQGKKQVTLNNNRVTSAALAKQFPVVLFSPESLAAIKEGPDQRRQLLDDVVVTHSTSSVKILKDFQHALKTRNRILKDFKRGLAPDRQTKALLESLEPSFLPLATELAVARLKALKALESDFRQAAKFVLASPSVDISVEYLISGEMRTNGHARTSFLRCTNALSNCARRSSRPGSLWWVRSVTIFASYLLEKIHAFFVRRGSKEL